jgi:uncharacterized protein (TIGR02996 family)
VSLRDAFLNALAHNEDDTATRLVFADWLEEHGEHEEADRQRKWPAAKEWLARFCRDHNPPPDHSDPIEQVISYEELIETGRATIEEADEWGSHFFCFTNLTMCSALRDNSREFWKNWSVVTGIPVPQDVQDKCDFTCGC